MNKTKQLGQTFTEFTEVNKMIKMYSSDITKAKIMEPSFGDGQFLIQIIRIIVKELLKKKWKKIDIANHLKENIHGFELDTDFYNHALRNIRELLENELDMPLVELSNLRNETALQKVEHNFDLIIGNPPYVRVQNFDSGSKQIKSTLSRTGGNTDLFLMFIDHFLNYLKKNGEFIFIVPNSLGKSKAASQLRKWMSINGSVKYFDYEDTQLFPKVSVYSCIFHFKNNSIDKSQFIEMKNKKKFILDTNSQFWIPKTKNPIDVNLGIKNGVATLADSIYIYKKGEEPNIEKTFLLNIFKGSRQSEKYIAIFPYKIIKNKVERFKSDIEIKRTAPKMYKYLEGHKTKLMKRSLEKKTHWFEYGRSQAIKDVVKTKFLINTLIKPNQKKLEYLSLEKNTLVFSGLYSTTDKFIEFNNEKLIQSLRFKSKDMRGGYKKISSSLLKYEK